jgi:hypothetical protein
MGVKNLAKKFNAPSLVTWLLIPFIVFTVIFLILGYLLFKKAYKKGGIESYPKECNTEAGEACKDSDVINCVDNYLKANCEDKKTTIGTGLLFLIHLLLALIIAASCAFGLYKLVLYIKNPKLAAGLIVLDAIF